ncbi:condensation domain-containing protein [Pseudoduganella sp. LjRoot289]|uniref:condensation domain-containing protein n=1 Tax=Pseudoduganella sp. LjRoot289 TaxID=3342314 RepID=UPI003ED0FEE7
MQAQTFPLAMTQQYIVDQCLAEAPPPWCYHTQFSYHLQAGTLALPLFFKALRQVLARHPVLRTRFSRGTGGAWRQHTDADPGPQPRFEDISGQAALQQEAWLERLLLDDRNRPFDLLDAAAPLFRSYLVKRSAHTVQLVLAAHHAIFDGWSLAVLLKEIFAFYQQLKDNPTLNLAPARYDYADFIALEAARGEAPEAAAFWRGHLARHAAFRPARGSGTPPRDAYRPAVCVLPAALLARLQAACLKQKLPLKSLFVTMFVRMLQDESGLGQTTLGLVSNGRSIALKHPLTTLGLLWNMVPLCVPALQEDGAQWQAVQAALQDSAAFAHYPLQHILRDRGADQLFHAAFNYIDFGGARILPPGADFTFLETGGLDQFHFPLYLLVGMHPIDRQVSLVLNYDARCYDEAWTGAALRRCLERLEQLCAGMGC